MPSRAILVGIGFGEKAVHVRASSR